jgi:hypothetical protein
MDKLLTLFSLSSVLITWIIFSTRYKDIKPRYHSFIINSIFIGIIWFVAGSSNSPLTYSWSAPWSFALNLGTLFLYHSDPFPMAAYSSTK